VKGRLDDEFFGLNASLLFGSADDAHDHSFFCVQYTVGKDACQ
jgi:hypothetical protein